MAAAWAATDPAEALAQTLPDSGSREAQRIQEQQAGQARERAEQFQRDRDTPPRGEGAAPAPAEPDDTGHCVAVRKVRLAGATRFSPRQLAGLTASLVGDCVSIRAINQALRGITNRYVGAGFVTSRAAIAPQDFRDGILTITVVEGRLDGIVPGPGRPYGRHELRAAFPQRGDGLLSLRALEQGVDQLARLAGSAPSIDIVPGAFPGTSTVQVMRTTQAGWLRPSVTFNNDGSASTGRWQALFGLDIDSPFGRGDAWSLYYQRDAGADRLRATRAYGGFAALPLGWWTVTLSAGQSRYRSVLSGIGNAFITRGASWNAGATLERMIRRDAKTKWTLSGGLAVTDARNFIQGIRLQSSSYRIVSANLTTRWQRRMGTSQVAVSGGLRRGVGLLGAHTVDTGPGGATGRFTLAEGDATMQSRFAIGPTRLTNNLLLRSQYGFDNLLPAQRFSLGGTATVRGFRDDGLSGRSGLSLREQLGFGIADVAPRRASLRTAVSGFLAVDAGLIVPQPGEAYERGVIDSMSAGLRIDGRHIVGELVLAVPLSAPSWVRFDPASVSASLRIQL